MADPKVTYRFTAKDDTKDARESVVRGFSRMQVGAVAAIGLITAAVTALNRLLDGAVDRLQRLDSQIKQARGLGIDEERLRRIQDVFTAGGAERDDATRAATRLQQELQLGIRGDDPATGRERVENFRTLGIGRTNARFLEENPDLALLAILRAIETGGIEQQTAANEILGRRLGAIVNRVAPNLSGPGGGLEVAAERAFETPDELADLAEQLADQQETARRAREQAAQTVDIRTGRMALARSEFETRFMREFGGEQPIVGTAVETFETAVDGWQQATDLLIQSIRRF